MKMQTNFYNYKLQLIIKLFKKVVCMLTIYDKKKQRTRIYSNLFSHLVNLHS